MKRGRAIQTSKWPTQKGETKGQTPLRLVRTTVWMSTINQRLKLDRLLHPERDNRCYLCRSTFPRVPSILTGGTQPVRLRVPATRCRATIRL